jgi:CubicO group peptidase (beta-lactamase class C family)
MSVRVAQTVALAAAISALGGCAAQVRTTGAPEVRLAAVVVPLLRQYHAPSAAIAVLRDGVSTIDTIFTADGQAISQRTRYSGASLTKPVLATVVEQLADRGRISLDSAAAFYLPWPQLADPRADRITIRQLLSHSSGLGVSADGTRAIMEAEPGARWKYSGAGYSYLQRIVEQIAGAPLEAVLQREIFAPLGMRSTTVVDADSGSERWAVGHDRAGRPLPTTRYSRALGGTSIRTTAADYARFMQSFLNPASRVLDLSAASRRSMTTGRVAVDTTLDLFWGEGWGISGSVFFHWGSNPGFKSLAFADRASGTVIVILTDGDNGLEIAEPIVRAVTGKRYSLFRFYMLHPTD